MERFREYNFKCIDIITNHLFADMQIVDGKGKKVKVVTVNIPIGVISTQVFLFSPGDTWVR